MARLIIHAHYDVGTDWYSGGSGGEARVSDIDSARCVYEEEIVHELVVANHRLCPDACGVGGELVNWQFRAVPADLFLVVAIKDGVASRGDLAGTEAEMLRKYAEDADVGYGGEDIGGRDVGLR